MDLLPGSQFAKHLSGGTFASGEITGQSALSAGLILVMSLQGTIEGQLCSAGDLAAPTLLSGQVDAASVLQADLTRLSQITGAIFGQGVLTASIEVHRGLGVAVSMLHAEPMGGALLIGVTLFRPSRSGDSLLEGEGPEHGGRLGAKF